jgi:hypothetical protein
MKPPIPKIHAAVTCVDYADLLTRTIFENARILSSVTVATSPHDESEAKVLDRIGKLMYYCDWHVHFTDAFTANGAVFNRGAAINEVVTNLIAKHPNDWILVLDADILFPPGLAETFDLLEPGNLYGCRRRILQNYVGKRAVLHDPAYWVSLPMELDRFPVGYFQLFHASDPVLQSQPIYPTHWRHAGGSDDEFQQKWPRQKKHWLPADVLHIGPTFQNWCGRNNNPQTVSMMTQIRERLTATPHDLRNKKPIQEKIIYDS